MNSQLIIAIEHIIRYGCDGLECVDCPLTDSSGKLSGYDELCEAVQEYCGGGKHSDPTDAINKIILNGCPNLQCDDCPLADDSGMVMEEYEDLCQAIDEL